MSKLLNDFIQSGKSFWPVFNSSGKLIRPDTGKLCILDSSFNPPHRGHYSLVKESLLYKNCADQGNKNVLLLLSVNNADKKTPKPASFEHRIEMMMLLAERIHDEMKVDVSVGLTNCAMFAEKCSSIQEHIEREQLSHGGGVKMSFLLGFDTLIRVLDPKYYLPVPIKDALHHFFTTSEVLCLTRDMEHHSSGKQLDFVLAIKEGRLKDIPSSWASKITLVANENTKVATISSSAIRRSIFNRETVWIESVTPEIRAYIMDKQLYH